MADVVKPCAQLLPLFVGSSGLLSQAEKVCHLHGIGGQQTLETSQGRSSIRPLAESMSTGSGGQTMRHHSLCTYLSGRGSWVAGCLPPGRCCASAPNLSKNCREVLGVPWPGQPNSVLIVLRAAES